MVFLKYPNSSGSSYGEDAKRMRFSLFFIPVVSLYHCAVLLRKVGIIQSPQVGFHWKSQKINKSSFYIASRVDFYRLFRRFVTILLVSNVHCSSLLDLPMQMKGVIVGTETCTRNTRVWASVRTSWCEKMVCFSATLPWTLSYENGGSCTQLDDKD